MKIERHDEHSFRLFFLRTISAQLHFLAAIGALVAMVVLLHYARQRVDWSHFWACFVFGFTSLLVFGTSAIYHFLSDGYRLSPRLMKFLENLDHFAIYLFIAGTYTPFLLNSVENPWANFLMASIWVIALLGIAYTLFKQKLPVWMQSRLFYTGIFILMGWTIVVRIGEIYNALSPKGLFLLVGGGLAYSIGAVVYALKWPRLWPPYFGFHELWHLAVILGYIMHYFLILGFYHW